MAANGVFKTHSYKLSDGSVVHDIRFHFESEIARDHAVLVYNAVDLHDAQSRCEQLNAALAEVA